MEKTVVYESVAVHDFAEYMQGCINVLDEEWARSASSRYVGYLSVVSNILKTRAAGFDYFKNRLIDANNRLLSIIRINK